MKNSILWICFICVIVANAAYAQMQQLTTDPHSHFYCVILAGGVGERLWPLSRQQKPKQLLEIHEHQTLLDQAVARVATLVNYKNIFISTTKQFESKIAGMFLGKIGGTIVEPGLRNTGPAILLSCIEIYEKDPEAIIAFLPSDPFIPSFDNFKFNQALDNALQNASRKNQIILLGVKPTYPATGYGYIEFDESDLQPPFPIKKFHEKPALAIAQKYIESGSMLWNIGMFCGKASVFIHEYKKFAPEIYHGVVDYCTGKADYDDVKSDSIDYAVMEKSKKISVLPVDFDWCDVGNIEVFLSIKKQAGSLSEEKVIQTHSSNNLVDVPKKLVALIGVHDLCIVETDEVLLITSREEAEKVRDIVKQIKHKELHEFL
jgi:mannose-1-phosphate guanylyltransferase